MLKNRNHGDAVFVPKADGSGFERFNGLSGVRMPVGPQDSHGLFSEDGRLYHGRLPREMALDAMPPQIDAGKAQAIGQRRQQMDEGGNGAISREHATALHNAAHKAGVTENDLDAFGRVLAALTGGEPGPAAQDAGGRKLSKDQANQIQQVASGKLSPAEMQQLISILQDMTDESLPDSGDPNSQASDQPPPFKGMPKPGGGITGDQALKAFNADWPEVARIKQDTMGMPIPKSSARREAESARLALDARTRTSGSSLEDFNREWPSIARIGRCY